MPCLLRPAPFSAAESIALSISRNSSGLAEDCQHDADDPGQKRNIHEVTDCSFWILITNLGVVQFYPALLVYRSLIKAIN